MQPETRLITNQHDTKLSGNYVYSKSCQRQHCFTHLVEIIAKRKTKLEGEIVSLIMIYVPMKHILTGLKLGLLRSQNRIVRSSIYDWYFKLNRIVCTEVAWFVFKIVPLNSNFHELMNIFKVKQKIIFVYKVTQANIGYFIHIH